MSYWTAKPTWPGEPIFVVCGGPSVEKHNLECLRGRRVLVVNSSCYAAPWADVLFFGDSRWWRENRKAVAEFGGLVVSVAPSAFDDKIKRMQKRPPPGLTDDRAALTMRRTSTLGALSLIKHFGPRTVVTLGLDGGDVGGRTHHHKPHPWPQRVDCWDEQRKDLAGAVEPLKASGITVLNASPGSAVPFWPVVTLEEALCRLPSA